MMKISISTLITGLFMMAFVINTNAAEPLPEGASAPDFTGIDQNGNEVTLQDQLNEGPVVMMFYRGQWCPVCNQHLETLQDSLSYIEERGANVLAVSPEKQERLNETVEKTGAEFTVLWDQNETIMEEYGVAFEPPESEVETYNIKLDANLQEAHGGDQEQVRLPIPATYIIDADGEILYVHHDEDYKNRAGVEDILNELD